MQARLTVENDNRSVLFAVRDLLWLHNQIGIPVVFDFHVSAMPCKTRVPCLEMPCLANCTRGISILGHGMGAKLVIVVRYIIVSSVMNPEFILVRSIFLFDCGCQPGTARSVTLVTA